MVQKGSKCFTTDLEISVTSHGILPPLVSHITKHLAPASAAVSQHFIAYSGSALYPSKKCSRSTRTVFPKPAKYATESCIISKFSSRVALRISVTCHEWALTTIHTVGTSESMRAWICGSSSTATFLRRLEPNATSFARACSGNSS